MNAGIDRTLCLIDPHLLISNFLGQSPEATR